MSTVPRPRVTGEQIRRVQEVRTSVIVWLPTVDMTDVAVTGLTPAQADSPEIVPVLWIDQVEQFLAAAGGSHAGAAKAATADLAAKIDEGVL